MPRHWSITRNIDFVYVRVRAETSELKIHLLIVLTRAVDDFIL